MYKLLFSFLFLTSCYFSKAQTVLNVEYKVSGEIKLDNDISIPKINSGYTVWLPEVEKVKGLIVFIRSRRDTIKTDQFIDYAVKNKLAVMYATTDNKLEFFFSNSKMQEIENYVFEVISKYNIPQNNLFYAGMSLEGTRALKLAIYSQSEASKFKLKPCAIAICDSPLDMVRFSKELVKAFKLNFNAIAANEGKWVSNYLYDNLGGYPADNLEAYINYSPYCYIADGGKYIDKFRNIAIRAYTEPDVEWWMKTRRKDYYGMNSIDLAAFINELNIAGNMSAELIATENKGYFENGDKHPHSWNIVDEKALIDWFLNLIQ